MSLWIFKFKGKNYIFLNTRLEKTANCVVFKLCKHFETKIISVLLSAELFQIHNMIFQIMSFMKKVFFVKVCLIFVGLELFRFKKY